MGCGWSTTSLCYQGLPWSWRHYSASARVTTRCQVGAKEMQTPNHRLQIQGLLQLSLLESYLSLLLSSHSIHQGLLPTPCAHFPHCFLACMYGVLHSSHPLSRTRLSFKLSFRDEPHTAALTCRIPEHRCQKRALSSPSDLLKIRKTGSLRQVN